MIKKLFGRTIILLGGLLLATSGSVVSAQTPAPGYNSSWKNNDGSSKLALQFGGGYSLAVGGTRQSQTRGWNYIMGSGYNFNNHFSVLGRYTYNHFSVPQGQIAQLFGPGELGQLAGDVHLWSLTVEPSYQYFNTAHYGGYVLVGGGFYRKRTLFRQTPGCPDNVCGPPTNNVADFSNNAGGIDFGVGFNRRISERSNTKLFFEARYVWVDNQASPNNTYYPPANERTSFLPVSGGVRW